MTVSTIQSPPEQRLRVVVASGTDEGGRDSNEDALLVVPLSPVVDGASDEGYLAIVADGMGGYQRGEIASQMAIDVIRKMFEDDPGTDPATLLKQAFRRANDQIYQSGMGASPSSMMGTTLIVAATRGKYATIANIGDSRAYLARANRLTQITKDHSLVAEQVAAGAMTEREARESPQRNILTHALGHRPKLDSKVPDIFELTLLPEDRLLLCTDGFHDVVAENDLLNVLLTSEPEHATRRLIDLAKERGTTDNVTAVVFEALPAREQITITRGDSRGVPVWIGLVAAAVLLIVIAMLLLLFVI